MTLETNEKIDRIWLYVLTLGILLGFTWIIHDNHKFKEYIKAQQNIVHGKVTWYAKGVHKDGTSYKGDYYNCASNYFPRYSMLLIKNKLNNKTVKVWVNDTCETPDVIVDLSRRAFKQVCNLERGVFVGKIMNLGVNKKPDHKIFGKIQRRLK
jgi:rare lipoprotein A (peptidoglycan hydrolase)